MGRSSWLGRWLTALSYRISGGGRADEDPGRRLICLVSRR